MKLMLSWLRDFAPIAGSADEIGRQLTDLGLAVEEQAPADAGVHGIVVARVLDLRPHPDADRIQLVDVDAGDGEPLQICCGAFNMAEGDLVPLAPIGSTMGNGMEIARRKMRGEWSNGMLCSGPEVGLGDDAGGILILPDELEPGTSLAAALGLAGDTWFELEVNANRPDAMSVAGVARDLAAHQGVPFSLPDYGVPRSGAEVAEDATVEIVDPTTCGRFVARVLRGVRMDASPLWLTTRLILGGMRPINRVVDVSNYVMLELGYPNHTYDLDRVAGRTLRVRSAEVGEGLTTLDDVDRRFEQGDVLICDGDDAPIGVAGVMGGASTEISETTGDVLLEMAWWFPMRIARTSTRLALRSEASLRFERGTDPMGIDRAMDRFCQLLGSSVDSIAPGQLDERGDLPSPSVITMRPERVNAVLGTDVDPAAMGASLEAIGFSVEGDTGHPMTVVAPSFRPDVTTEIDLIEEVARHHGYDRIERTVPGGVRFGRLESHQRDRRRVRSALVGLGLSEAMPLPFLGDDDLARAGLDPAGIGLANPLDAEASVLRTSLRPGLLKAVALNERHRQPGVRLFEIGRVFPPPEPGRRLPDEREQVAVVLAGREAPEAVELAHTIVDVLRRPSAELASATERMAGLHPGRSAEVVVAETSVGLVGEVDPAVLDAYAIDERVAWLELDLTALDALADRDRPYETVSRHPSSDIDLAFIVGDAVPAGAVEATIAEAAGPLLAEVALFDVYRGETLGADRRSLAYRLRFQAADRTLTDDEVGERRQAVVEAAATAHGAELRA